MDDVLRQVVGVYVAEVKEQALAIAQALLAMENNAQSIPTQIEELYRQAHSLKGSSASLGVTDLEQLAHLLETALLPVRRGAAPLTAELADLGLRAMDAAVLRGGGLLADDDEGKAEVQAAIRELQAITHVEESAAAGGSVATTISGTGTGARTGTGTDRDISGAGAGAEEDTVRVAAAGIAELERRLDELRTLRGRLDERAAGLAAAARTIEKAWREAELLGRAEADALYQSLRQLVGLRLAVRDDAELAQASAAELDENLRGLRMVPAALLLDPLQRAVRDACRRTGKEAACELAGGDVRIDRRVLEQLKHPLLHLVRNAVDHGIEPPPVREAIGKPVRGTVAVTVEQRGGDLALTVRDDGRGIDGERVRERAVELGLHSAEAAAALDERELLELLFQPGFSTAREVTEMSGRGVGLDVVRDALLRMQGRVELSSTLGRGTTCTLAVPLTVVASEAMLLEDRGRRFALPLTAIARIVRAPASAIRRAAGRAFFDDEGRPLPVVSLARVIGLADDGRDDAATHRTLAVVQAGSARAALACERMLGEASLVLRPLPPELQGIKLLHTAAVLANGQAIFVLSPRAVVAAALEAREEGQPAPPTGPGAILVADDSITTRSLLRNALEASGFLVRTAADGDEALRLALAERFDVVVSDVRMPRLDGFGLTARLRQNPRTARLPVVLFSSLDSAEDKRRGRESGADAYLEKGAFDRGLLLDVVTDLVQRQRGRA